MTNRISVFRSVHASLLVACLFLAPMAQAVETKVIRDQSFVEFNQGESTGTELMAQGRLRIAPRAQRLEKSEEGVAWQVAADPYDGHVFYSTGHNGKVFHRAPDGKTELWADLTEVEAIALAIDPTGAVLVGASPGGKIYRIAEANKPQVHFETKEQYIWDMAFDRSGVLYAATGPNGKIFRIRGTNNGEVFYDSNATNIMALTFDPQGRLIAATQGKAYVLRIEGASNAYVLYASEEDECRALAVDQHGNIYVAVNSARVSPMFDRGGPEPSGPTSAISGASATPTPRPGIVLEVRAEGSSGPPSPPSMGGGGSQSFIAQIQPNNFVSNFWRSPESPIQSVHAMQDGQGILVAAGSKGKIYRLQSDTNYSVVADVEESTVLSFAESKDRTYFTTANKASLYELAVSPAREGLFASRALNAGSTVHWGNLFYEAEESSGAETLFETRTGNTPEPEDQTWSPWTSAVRIAPRIFRVESPVAQYLQYRVTLRATAGDASPVLDSVQFFHVQQNVAPIVRDIRIDKVGGEGPSPELAILIGAGGPRGMSRGMPSRSGSASSRDRDSGGGGSFDGSPGPSLSSRMAMAAAAGRMAMGGGSSFGGDETPESRPTGSAIGSPENSQKFNISWDVTDPNQDKLQFRLLFKGEDETEWKLIEKDLTAPRFTFSTEAIPDGKYRVRVEATDAPQNPDTSASTVTLVSRIFLVDNSQPEIRELRGTKVGADEYEITASAKDETSIIAAAEYNIDVAKEWRAVFPEDGMFDFNRETFRFRAKAEQQSPEHTLSLRVYDREGNSRVEKVLLRQTGGK